MIRIRLSDADVGRLEQALRGSDDPKFRTRLQIVLMAHRGRAHQDIATDVAVVPRTVQRWLNTYLADGLEGLRPKTAKGQPPSIPMSRADEVKRWVIEGPAPQGLDRANWTYAELADHLKRVHGIRTSRSAVQRFCAAIGIRPYRPSYRYLRADPLKQAKARQELAELKKS
jgi:transposase